jgi:hypothetical protein
MATVEEDGAGGWREVLEDLGEWIEGDFSVLEKEMFVSVDASLRRSGVDIDDILHPLYDHPKVLLRIIFRLSTKPDSYSSNFVKIFTWFLTNPHPETSQRIHLSWKYFPCGYKEAIRLYYHQKFDEYSERYYPLAKLLQKHPLLQWLERFEQKGVITSSLSSSAALQAVSERIGLDLRDTVRYIETVTIHGL